MTVHLFGAIVTDPGVAANNRGETEGNITTLQKLVWKEEVYTTVSAEAIRWAIRYYWQMRQPEEVNRFWNDAKGDHESRDKSFQAWDPVKPSGTIYWDDDLLGFMDARAGSEESEVNLEIPRRRNELEAQLAKKPEDKKLANKVKKFEELIAALLSAREEFQRAKDVGIDTKDIEKRIEDLRKKAALKGQAVSRRGVLEIARAISTRPYAGDITFNARSGEKDRTSLYGTEMHATRYQYGFAMTPERLRIRKRAIDAIGAICSLGEVAGNHSRFLFDFSPASIVLRMTDDPAPRILYCFVQDEEGSLSVPNIVSRVNTGDIEASELFIGGPISENEEIKKLAKNGRPHRYPGVKECVREFIKVLQPKLGEPTEDKS